MKFFANFNVPKESKIAITGLLSNITTKADSHKGGWTKLLRCQLVNLGYNNVTILSNKDSLLNFDVVVFDLGAEFGGTINLFGGLDEKCFTRIGELIHFRGQMFSWRHALPDLAALVNSRLGNESTYEEFQNYRDKEFSMIKEKIVTTSVFDHVYKTDKLLISDSHGPGVWDPSYMIEREDGRTLHGLIKNHSIEEVLKKTGPVTELMVHTSSIDVRHHLMRQSDPIAATHKLISDLGQLLFLYKQQGLIKRVILMETMGIEDESRELPKTGYYKGTPFYGTWAERNNIREYFNQNINALKDACVAAGHDWHVCGYPDYFFDETGKLKFDVMEKPQSVHISPEHYRWNLDKNEPR